MAEAVRHEFRGLLREMLFKHQEAAVVLMLAVAIIKEAEEEVAVAVQVAEQVDFISMQIPGELVLVEQVVKTEYGVLAVLYLICQVNGQIIVQEDRGKQGMCGKQTAKMEQSEFIMPQMLQADLAAEVAPLFHIRKFW